MENNTKKAVRIYTRNPNDTKQGDLVSTAQQQGDYEILDIYHDKGIRSLGELYRLINALQPNEILLLEDVNHIRKLPFLVAEKLVNSIKNNNTLVLENKQRIDPEEILSSANRKGRPKDIERNRKILEMLDQKCKQAQIATYLNCSISTIEKVKALRRQ